MEAAKRLFSLRGFDGVSMDAIAAEARVTKPTLYRYYSNKETLFAGTLRSLLEDLPAPETLIFQRQGNLKSRLQGIARDLLQLGTGPLMTSLHRMLSLPMESASYDAEELWEANFQPYYNAMQRLLRAEHDAKVLDVDDAVCATTHFFSLIAGEPMVRLFLTGTVPLDQDAAEEHVAAAVQAFLRAYRGKKG